MKRVHLLNGCSYGKNPTSDRTLKSLDFKQVTCSLCLKLIKAKGLVPRDSFPPEPFTPTFQVTYEAEDPEIYSMSCPCCGKVNYHESLGQKVSHCRCWKGYILERGSK